MHVLGKCLHIFTLYIKQNLFVILIDTEQGKLFGIRPYYC